MWKRWTSTRIDLATALALLAIATYALVAAPRHIEATAHHQAALAAGICAASGAAPTLPTDAPAHDGSPCCALGGAFQGGRLLPAADVALAAPPADAALDAPIGATGPTHGGSRVAGEQARPRAPPADITPA